MGLDIVLHEKVHVIDQAMDDLNCFRAHVIDVNFEKNISELIKNAYYVSEKRTHCFGYAYSMHSTFRSKLCLLTGKDGDYWRDFHNEKDPFHELLYFADNEGCIDWNTSEKLYVDFCVHEFDLHKINDEWFTNIYIQWLKLFEVARIEGNVIEFS